MYDMGNRCRVVLSYAVANNVSVTFSTFTILNTTHVES